MAHDIRRPPDRTRPDGDRSARGERDDKEESVTPAPEPGTGPGVESFGELIDEAVASFDDGNETTRAVDPGPEFDDLIRQHGRRLFILAYRLCGNRSDAEDLSQEALVRGFQALPRFRGEANFYTYLYRIVVNLWSNQVRSRRRWRFLALGGGSDRDDRERSIEERLADRSPDPHQRLVGQEQTQRLHRALAELDPDQRAVLILRVAEGLEYEEIATALEIPIGTVRSRLARARSRIRRLMEM